MSKRGENIRKRSDGRWESRLLNKETGKYKYFYGKTYSEVKQKRYDFDISIQAETDITKSQSEKDLFAAVFDLWLSETQTTVKKSTYLNYYSIIRLYLIPMFGNLNIKNLTVQKINGILCEWLKTADKKLSSKYVHDILSVLKATLAFTIGKYGCHINLNEILSVQIERKDITVLSNYEQQRLIKYLLSNPDYGKIGVILCLYTGMRIGEICALKWSDIHICEGYIDISKSMYRIKNVDKVSVNNIIPQTIVVTEKPKTAASARKIPICDFIGKVLSETGTHDPDNYFLTDSGKYFEPRTYQNRFKQYLNGAEIQAVNFHVLRHTFATNCINAGCDVKSLSEILGHSSVKITLDKYVHPSMDTKKNQLDKLTVYSF